MFHGNLSQLAKKSNSVIRTINYSRDMDLYQVNTMCYLDLGEMTCSFHYTAFVVSGKVRIPWTILTTPGSVGCTQTDRPKSVRNRCVIGVWWCCCVVTLLIGFSWRCMGFCHRTESDHVLILLESDLNTLLNHNQQLYGILSRSNLAVWTYRPCKD